MYSVFEQLPVEFRAVEDPEELVKLWRGDKAGRHITGMLCRLGDDAAAYKQVEAAVLHRTRVLNRLIDWHTSGYRKSPLVSVTTAISRAQAYSSNPDETIYELSIAGGRLLKDPYHIGSPMKGNDTELFVIGSIAADDIQAVKTNNHDKNASELMYEKQIDGRVLNFIADPFFDPAFRHNPDQLPNPAGTWEKL